MVVFYLPSHSGILPGYVVLTKASKTLDILVYECPNVPTENEIAAWPM
jgi:hypothetical protein